MRQRLVIVGIQERNLKLITNQLEIIFDSKIEIFGLTLKELNYNKIKSTDIVLLTTVEMREIVMPFLPKESFLLVAKRSENLLKMKPLFMLDCDQTILVVNDNYSNTRETVNSLVRILPNLTFLPYTTNERISEEIDIIVTPGENHLIPIGFKKVIDIGPRIISLETVELLKEEIAPDLERTFLSQLYFKSMVYINDDMQELYKDIIVKDENNHRRFETINTNSHDFKLLMHRAKQLAKTNLIIHIEGEKGTGKEMLAEMIHNASDQFAEGIFYSYNCDDKDPQIIRSELFGNAEGQGLLSGFPKGTLFLKNIDTLPFTIQLDMVSFLANYSDEISREMRLITSTKMKLKDLRDANSLRKELYHILGNYILGIPTLRERHEDILPLIDSFKSHLNKSHMFFSDQAIDTLLNYHWPGNIRELYNVISYCVCLNTNLIEMNNLPLFFKGEKKNQQTSSDSENINYNEIINEIERHGFLKESIMLMNIFKVGKEKNQAYGRGKLKTLLQEQKYKLSEQQLRSRIDILNHLGLLIVRKGRSGTTISNKGEKFLVLYKGHESNLRF